MAATAGKDAQTPVLFVPDDRPPRLTDAAKTAIRKLAGYVDQSKISEEDAMQDYDAARQASGAEPEPRLLFGLVLLKMKNREKAMEYFQTVKSELPQQLLPYAALAWLRMEKRTFPSALDELKGMINAIPKPARPNEPLPSQTPEPFSWAGQLRDYAAAVGDPSQQLTEQVAALDAAVAARGPAAKAIYEKGRQHSVAILADFDRKTANATEEADIDALKVKRKLLGNYTNFPISQCRDQILAHLDE